MAIRPIRDYREVKGSVFYIQVTAEDKLYITILQAKGCPRRTKATCSVQVRKFFSVNGKQWNVMDCVQSLRDLNVVPCTYSNDTLWRMNMKTLKFLQNLVQKKDEGYKEYLAILERYGLCTPYEVLKKNKEHFL